MYRIAKEKKKLGSVESLGVLFRCWDSVVEDFFMKWCGFSSELRVDSA
jgi:hypothetical protein